MAKRIGKIVSGVQYIHKCLLDDLSYEDYDVYFLPTKEAVEKVLGTNGLPLMLDWAIMSIDRKNDIVSFTECPDWDKKFEPSIGNRITVKLGCPIDGTETTVKYTKANKKNPQIYHRRHLFVSDDYTAFNLGEDMKRVYTWEKLNPDTRRMGRRIWWDNFCKENSL